MDPSLRHTTGLIARIEKLRDELIKHYEALIARCGVDKTDRNTTAITQYQMQVETATIIRAAEDLQVLIRQMQEMWLFGQLDTLGEGRANIETDEKAKVVAGLLKTFVERQNAENEAASGHEGEVVNGGGMGIVET